MAPPLDALPGSGSDGVTSPAAASNLSDAAGSPERGRSPGRAAPPRDGRIFATSLATGLVGILAGALLFPAHASLVGGFLVALAQGPLVEALLDRNRDDIWARRLPSVAANGRLARSLLALFLGIFAAYVVGVQAAPFARIEGWFGVQLGGFASGSLRDVHFGTLGELLLRNGGVMVVCFATAVLYGHGGMLLVLAWNASRWGVIFSWVARVAAHEAGGSPVASLTRTLACILPHLALEATAYILVAMGGVFVTRGALRHRLGSPELAQVAGAVLRIVAVAAAVLAAAAAVESTVAPALAQALGS